MQEPGLLSVKNGKRKTRFMDGGKVSVRFTGSIDLNALGTTIVILGSFALLILVVSGVFFRG